MKHYGDITKLNGYDLPPVDVITGGSPCQDLSVAGKRVGLEGERSGLFMDQVRIVKEMRQADVLRGRSGQFIRPRYMVWENVPGAFSSGNPKGADFAAVIEEIIKVCEEGAGVSVCVPDGGWTKSGCYYAEDGSWSIAWRVHDAQFWGVPQRRKRIALVADFGGLSAPEILFERKGLSRDPEPSGTERQRITGGVEGSLDRTIAGTLDSNYFKGAGERNGVERDVVVETITTHDKATRYRGGGAGRHDDGGGNGLGIGIGQPAPAISTSERHGVFSFQERAGKPGGGARESSYSMNTPEHCSPSITNQCLTDASNRS